MLKTHLFFAHYQYKNQSTLQKNNSICFEKHPLFIKKYPLSTKKDSNMLFRSKKLSKKSVFKLDLRDLVLK